MASITVLFSLGDVNNAIEYLTMYLDIAKRLGNKEVEGAACSRLAALYNSLVRALFILISILSYRVEILGPCGIYHFSS